LLTVSFSYWFRPFRASLHI